MVADGDMEINTLDMVQALEHTIQFCGTLMSYVLVLKDTIGRNNVYNHAAYLTVHWR